MKGLILAAGRGSRMLEQTRDCPKGLVMLSGRSLLDRQLDALKGSGLKDVALVRGYLGHMFEGRGLVLFENPDWSRTNMVMSLTKAATWLESSATVVSYADIFYPSDAVRQVIGAKGDIVISYDPDWLSLWGRRFTNPLEDAETFCIDDDGRLLEIGEKTHDAERIQGQYTGLFKLTPTGWAIIAQFLSGLDAETRNRLDVTSLLAKLIRSGVEVRGVAIPGPWGEVDLPSDIELYERPDFPLPRIEP